MNYQKACLPTHFAAIRFACNCCGIKTPGLNKMLRAVRDREAKADKKLRLRLIKEGAIAKRPFPRKLNRVMLGKAETVAHAQEEGLCTVAYQAVYEQIRFDGKMPLFGPASHLAEQMAIHFPRLYAEIAPFLRTKEISEPEVMLILVREVFLPTFFLELKTSSDRGIGNELCTGDCWYFPKEHRGEREYPFPRVLKAWLNAAGCRYADDVGKLSQSDSKRRLISNWLKGKDVPDSKTTTKLVDDFQHETKRFDEAGAWKGRLAFAAAMHRLCRSMDDYFASIEPRISFTLLGLLTKIENELVPIDSDGLLADRKTFFAARLVYRRIKDTKQWKSKIASLSAGKSVSVPDSANEQKVEKIRKQMEYDMNSGNILLEIMQHEVSRLNKRNNELTISPRPVREQIFELGIEEVNRLLV